MPNYSFDGTPNLILKREQELKNTKWITISKSELSIIILTRRQKR
jgi:hypothetical protein